MNDGGPCFPLTIREPHGNFANDQHLPGLSLRDYFAGQALAGLCSNEATMQRIANEIPETPLSHITFAHRMGKAVAEFCFSFADSMLSERDKRKDR